MVRLRTHIRRFVWAGLFVLTLAAGSAAQEWRTEDNTRRISAMEDLRLDVRLAVMERREDELERRIGTFENLLYAVLAVVIGQLVLSGVAYNKSRKGGP